MSANSVFENTDFSFTVRPGAVFSLDLIEKVLVKAAGPITLLDVGGAPGKVWVEDNKMHIIAEGKDVEGYTVKFALEDSDGTVHGFVFKLVVDSAYPAAQSQTFVVRTGETIALDYATNVVDEKEKPLMLVDKPEPIKGVDFEYTETGLTLRVGEGFEQGSATYAVVHGDGAVSKAEWNFVVDEKAERAVDDKTEVWRDQMFKVALLDNDGKSVSFVSLT